MTERTEPAGSPQAVATRPVWPTALIELVVFFALSEGVYLILGGVAKTCLAELAACGPIATEASRSLFDYYSNESGARLFSNTFAIGLPGFNSLFYFFVAGFVIDYLGQLLATMAASLLIGFLVVWGYLAVSANRGIALRLVLAIVFAVGWWVLYNNTEASVYGSNFFDLAPTRYLEIPIAAVSLFIASFFSLRRR